MKLASMIVAALLAVGTQVAVSHASESASLHVDLDLIDGSHLTGTAPDGKAGLTTRYGRVELSLAHVARLTLGDDRETVRVLMRNADLIHGVLDDGSLDVRAYGTDVARRIRLRDVRSMRVTPPIRVAGSERARWEVTYEHALAWATENTSDTLTVTHIEPELVNHGSGGQWSRVRLTRTDGAPRKDFDLTAQISWDSGTAGLAAMHCIRFSLLDAKGDVVIEVGHQDAWSGEKGCRFSQVADKLVETRFGTQPLAGRARIEIVRREGKVTIKWNDVAMLTAELTTPVHRIQVRFDSYAYEAGGVKSDYGTTILERLELR